MEVIVLFVCLILWFIADKAQKSQKAKEDLKRKEYESLKKEFEDSLNGDALSPKDKVLLKEFENMISMYNWNSSLTPEERLKRKGHMLPNMRKFYVDKADDKEFFIKFARKRGMPL